LLRVLGEMQRSSKTMERYQRATMGSAGGAN
jgi:hypothetical protein